MVDAALLELGIAALWSVAASGHFRSLEELLCECLLPRRQPSAVRPLVQSCSYSENLAALFGAFSLTRRNPYAFTSRPVASSPAFPVRGATASSDDVAPIVAVVRGLVRITGPAEDLEIGAHVEKVWV